MRRNWLLTVALAAVVAAIITLSLVNVRPFWHPRTVDAQQALASPTQKSIDAPVAHQPAPMQAQSERNWPVDLAGEIAWPVTLLIIVLLITFNKGLRRLFGAGTKMVRRVRAAGVEMEISSEAADEVRRQLRDSFHELVGSARDEYERMADLQDIDSLLSGVIRKTVMARFGSLPKNLRATVHVRDIIFRDYLYQFVDYYPKGGGAHRRFSQRYGIIGRSWRSGASHGTGNAFGGSPSEEALVEEWGMTTEEAHGMINSRPSCLSIILRSDHIAVGILYMDSTEKNAFGSDSAALKHANELETDEQVVRLAEALGRALAPLKAGGPNLEIKELG